MNKKDLIKKIVAGFFYIGGILFAIFVTMVMLEGKRIFNILGLVICLMGVFIPIAFATFLLISSTQESDKRLKIMKISWLIIFVFYDFLLIDILFLGYSRQLGALNTTSFSEYIGRNTNLLPFKTIGSYIWSWINGSMNKTIIIENLLGNILLFAPMGILIPCTFQGLRKFKKFLFVMLVILVSVEIVQLLTHSGRCDIDDVILNLSGTIMLYWFWNISAVKNLLRKIHLLDDEKIICQ